MGGGVGRWAAGETLVVEREEGARVVFFMRQPFDYCASSLSCTHEVFGNHWRLAGGRRMGFLEDRRR